MSIKVDWQIVDEDAPELAEQPLPPLKSRRRLLRWRWVALGLLLVVSVAGFAAYYQWMYRTRLNQAIEPVRAVARLEAQAVAANDQVSFLALQDPDDAAWRATQGRRFGQLERVGLPEVGWQAIGAQPSPGNISLQPGGVQLDVTYRFSVTRPLPDGPVSVTLQVPQFYKEAASGWVRARPGTDYWGPWRTLAGRRFAMRYTQREASVLEGLIPRMDEILGRVCDQLPCPPQPIYVTFENAPDSFEHLSDLAFESNGFSLSFVSPHLIGLPADARSRDELYRVIGTRVVQALVYEASGRLNADFAASQALVRWELAQAGLTGPFITPAITQTLTTGLLLGARQSLSTLSLRSRPSGRNAALMPLAFAFIEEHFGAGSVARLAPAMGRNAMLGEAIRQTLDVNPTTLEPAWQSYLQQQTDLARARPPTTGLPVSPPEGELAVSCSTDNIQTPAAWRVRADGTQETQITPNGQMTWFASWSPDGRWLTYIESDHVSVMEADSQKVITIPVQGWPGWLPGGRLVVSNLFDEGPQDQRVAHVVNVETREDVIITGTYHTWSPNGKQLAYNRADDTLWIADADGRNTRQIAAGGLPVWSPDGKRLAFWGGLLFERAGTYTQTIPTEIQVMDVANSIVRTLARKDDLLRSADNSGQQGQLGSLAWSPDGLLLAVGIQREPEGSVLVLNADVGTVHTVVGRGALFPFPFIQSWSPDSRYLILWVTPDAPSEEDQGELDILDMNTGQIRPLSSIGLWDWSPDGKWLAMAQMTGNGGVWLVTPDLTNMYQVMEGMNCISVAWKP